MKKTSEEEMKIIKKIYKQPFYIGYNMLMESLKHKNILNGLSESLELAQIYLDSDDVILFHKNDNCQYKLLKNSRLSEIDSSYVSDIINNTDIDKIKYYKEEAYDYGGIKKISIVPVTEDKSYVIVIVNMNKRKNKEYRFIPILKDTFEVLVNKMNNYNYMKEQTEIDALTGLKNRQAYNKDIEVIDQEPNVKITFTIIDLFRLKYINDNINHFTGDCYIKQTAKILKDFFPSSYIVNDEEVPTGDEVYRIGGDEFIIISKFKTKEQINQIMEYVILQTKNMDLNINSDVIKGVNYGTVSRNANESLESLYKKADKKLSEDKQKTYVKYGLNRRK